MDIILVSSITYVPVRWENIYIYSLPPIRIFKFTALYLKVLDGNKGLIRSYLDLPECSVNCKALFNIARAPSTASSSRTVSVP
jgi:hypothetical protein